MLPPVRVVTECGPATSGVDPVFHVWTSITTSLAIAIASKNVAADEQLQYRVFAHEIIARTGWQDRGVYDTVSRKTGWPFKTWPSADLAKRGFVVREGDDDVYRAPDESVLLDDQFIERHCFWTSIDSSTSRGAIRLHFAPHSNLPVNDIAGTFWIDRTTMRLERLEFRYTRIVRILA